MTQATNLCNAYSANVTYQTGDIVMYGTSIYQAICVNQGVSPVDSNTWSLIFHNYAGITFRGIWYNNISYSKGQYVTHNGLAFISTIDNNVNITPVQGDMTYTWIQISPSIVISAAGDIAYQGPTSITRLPIGNTSQVLTVGVQGLPVWANSYPSGTANQLYQMNSSGVATWSDKVTLVNVFSTLVNTSTFVATTANVTTLNATTVKTTTANTSTLNVVDINTTGNVTIAGNLLVQGTTTTINTDVFKSTEYANVIIANTATVLSLSANTFIANTINAKGIVATSGYNGSYSNGIVVDYVTGNGRISVGTSDGLKFYAGGPGGTLLASISTSGGFTSPSVTANTLNVNNVSTIHSILETANVQAIAAGGTMNIRLNDAAVFYYTTNSTSNMTFNFIYDGVTSLNSLMSIGQSVTCALLVTQGGTAYYPTTIQVDGVTQTVKWPYGIAPSSGDTNSIDVYTFNIIKTASATYTVLGSSTKFA